MTRRVVVLILTHGRAHRQYTLDYLRKCGYKGEVYLICDDEDSELSEYKRLYGDMVRVFNKDEVERRSDLFDHLPERRCAVFARNVCFDMAAELGATHFLELDDDYSDIQRRFEECGKLMLESYNNNLERLFDLYFDFLDVSGAVACCMAQGGDYIGGVQSKRWEERLLRKAMNAYFCRVDRRFEFIGRINEDVCTYTTLSHRGVLFFYGHECDD